MASTAPQTMRNGMNGFSAFGTAMGNSPLPVELISFDAVAKGNTVLASWVTASEINNDYFEVEKSRDGNNFSSITEVKGAGNSNAALHYEVVDKNPYYGISYYRLRQVDFDGKQSLTGMRKVEIGGANAIRIYPNPVMDFLNIEFVSDDEYMMHSEITSVAGGLMLRESHAVNSGLNVLKSNIAHLAKGAYQLKMMNDKKEAVGNYFFIK